MPKKLRATKPTKYSPSKTKPGQALVPAEVLKRHLAGTLPDIQKNPMYTHDSEGHQISEDLSQMELHELYALSQRLKREYAERYEQIKQENDEKYKQSIIDEHTKAQTARAQEEGKGTADVSSKGDGAAS